MTDIAGRLGPGFCWGAATSAYQIEGATNEDGRGVSIWDTFAARPGTIAGAETGAVAADHYHRWREDVALIGDLGLDAYRFSVSWPRIQPDGRGAAEPRGLAFYDRLVDALLEAGIEPWPTLYHWDLPQPLEDVGGWPARDTAERFADYAGIVADALGDRIEHWTTLNEPWCSAFLGYGSGLHAPGRVEPAAAVAASHHLLLGHGLALERLRASRPAARVGITVNLYAVSAADATGRHDDAVRRIDGLMNRWFLDPLLRGAYPADVLGDLRVTGGTEVVLPGDLGIIATPLDFLGVNYYSRHVVAAGSWPGSAAVEFRRRPGVPRTASDWEVDAAGLTEVLTRLDREYPSLPLYVTENGAAYADERVIDGVVDDADREAFLAGHLAAVADARDAGADVRGYFAWSLLDNFEWAEGYAKRFGLVSVEPDTLARVPKRSARWYAGVVKQSTTKDTQ